MKTKIFIPILLIISALGLSGCGVAVVRGSGDVVTETRDVSNFDSLVFSGSGDVTVTQGDSEGLTVEAEENLMKYIRSEVRGRTLHIYFAPAGYFAVHPQKPMRFRVAMKDVIGLNLSGSGVITADKIVTGDLDINISGSGDVDIADLAADNLSLDISGSGKSRVNGTVITESIVISGSGNCDYRDLDSRTASVNVSGSGNTYVKVSEKLDIYISGSGDVTYTGVPKLTQHISGSGDIISK